MSRIDPSSQQPQSESGDLALHAGIGGSEAPAFVSSESVAHSIIALADSLVSEAFPNVTVAHLDSRMVVSCDGLYCAICLRCHEVVGLADSFREAVLAFCRVCDEVNTARVRSRHVLSRLLALRHGLSFHQSPSVNATAKS